MTSPDPVLDRLASLGLPFELVPCDPALADTAEFCRAYGYDPADSANCILVVGKAEPRRYAACVVLATTRLDVNGAVRRRLGTRKASFASADETSQLTGMAIGGVTPFGLPPAIPIWVDARVLERERIVLGGGTRHRKVVGRPQLLTALAAHDVVVEVVTALAREP